MLEKYTSFVDVIKVKLSVSVTKYHAMKAHSGYENVLGEWRYSSTSLFGRFTAGKRAPVPTG
jgi:hypothetical protein